MERRILMGIFFIFLGILFMDTVSAQLGGNLSFNDSEYATVSVNVSAKAMVDISPSVLSYNAVEPGEACGYDISNGLCNESSGNYWAIQIENIGSVNISKVWFNATYPTARPFGVGSNANTDAGNYVVLAKNTTTNEYWFINRVEYNETTTLYYIRDVDGNMPPNTSKYTYGRFRNGSNEYFWMIDKVSACNETPAPTFYIGSTAHSKTSTGSTDFTNSSGDIIAVSMSINNNQWAYADITTGPLSGLCVAIDSTCTRFFFSKWNADYPFNLCSNVDYAWYEPVDGPLVPGDSFAMKIGVLVPYGIYEGPSNSGRIYAIVSDT
ncbi:MAG: hypothetical protein DRO95_04110 [Candidatus Altiarchaeales archaeon]|nr:MAG: hypothetical protein DRO95_04110 [Candidatus Altiarchaeales archaeon]